MRYDVIELNWKTIDWHLDRRRALKKRKAEKKAFERHTYKRAKQFVWRDEVFFAEQYDKLHTP